MERGTKRASNKCTRGGDVAEHLLTGRRYIAGSHADYHKVVDLLSYLAGPEELPKYVEWL